MARAQGVSAATVQRIWDAHGEVGLLERRAALEDQRLAKDVAAVESREHVAQRVVTLHDIQRHLKAGRLGAQPIAQRRQWSIH
jgi:hypothetical protein